jgi:hypothetical protein
MKLSKSLQEEMEKRDLRLFKDYIATDQFGKKTYAGYRGAKELAEKKYGLSRPQFYFIVKRMREKVKKGEITLDK